MIVMLQDHNVLIRAQAELGLPCELLHTPTANLADNATDTVDVWSADNGISRFDPAAYRKFLADNVRNRRKCRWVAAPDVIGSARRTCELFSHWYPHLSTWPLAFVAQDGQENFEIPWKLIAAVFIGGSTHWKLGIHAEHIIKAAQAMEKWVHVGRVNTAQRIEKFMDLGVDSIDGTGLTIFAHFRKEVAAQMRHPKLNFEEAGAA